MDDIGPTIVFVVTVTLFALFRIVGPRLAAQEANDPTSPLGRPQLIEIAATIGLVLAGIWAINSSTSTHAASAISWRAQHSC